jgi:hypothetical protein
VHNHADVILFTYRSMNWLNIPAVRSMQQRYVFFNVEPPYLSGDLSVIEGNGFFNWTMTYRRDSDIFVPYVQFHKLEHALSDAEWQFVSLLEDIYCF